MQSWLTCKETQQPNFDLTELKARLQTISTLGSEKWPMLCLKPTEKKQTNNQMIKTINVPSNCFGQQSISTILVFFFHFLSWNDIGFTFYGNGICFTLDRNDICFTLDENDIGFTFDGNDICF